ncbi:Com family DNA-binding transcriptional regulator [uncultured Desulfovibrio sp.]|uniref:zinc finger domain-containing protein n=1 Tax=uncultured Desulfovibrio sp. TaxID=167968 RepID=UPI00345B52D1
MDKASLTNVHGLQAIRCGKCRKIIAYGYVIRGHIELKCASCATINTLRVLNPNHEPHDGPTQEASHA